ncbi:CAP domain-containing protein [Xylariaceae sp. FL1651]|nr:CAP domain-containing protein [Xylariaceae sp. FL1651]
MKSSTFLATTGAMLALASPLDKRVLVTDVVVEYYTVTVTGNPPAAPTPTHIKVHTQPVEQPAPEPTTTSQPVVVVTVTAGQQQQYQSQSEPTAPAEAPVPAPEAPASSPEPSTVVAAPAQPSQPADDDMQGQAIYSHNIHRSNHSAPALTWNSTIADYAAITAATCVFKHDMSEGDGHYGQNIALWGATDAASLGAAGAIKMATTNMWYDGEFNHFLPSFYGEATPDMSDFENWGHLSQMVWASSTSVGCAVQFCAKGTAYPTIDAWYSVCNYYPPGNVGGAYAQNVLRPKGDKSVSV